MEVHVFAGGALFVSGLPWGRRARVIDRRSIAIGLCLYSAALLAGCGEKTPSGQAAESEPVAFDWQGKNCLIVVLDALTVRHLSLWGYDRETSPNINKLAERGIVFMNTHSQASSTLPSVYSYFTGKYPPLLLLPPPPMFSAPAHLPESEYTFAEAFNDAGYDTYALSANMNVSDALGFGQGFDRFDYIPRYTAIDPNTGKAIEHFESARAKDFVDLDVTSNDSATGEILNRARAWIGEHTAPWLVYVHLLRPHNPYRAPDPLGSTFAGDYHGNADGSDAYWKAVEWKVPMADVPDLKNYYDGNIRYADDLVGAFLKALDDAGTLDNTAVIIMSDHGEAFMEHGYALHSASVHEELLHVPLIVIPPAGRTSQPATIDAASQLIDLYPTFAKAFGLETGGELDGSPLGSAVNRPLFSQNMPGNIACVVDGGMKLIAEFDTAQQRFEAREVYNLQDDPREQKNLLDKIGAKQLKDLLAQLRAFAANHEYIPLEDPIQLRGFDLKVLESLGYT